MTVYTPPPVVLLLAAESSTPTSVGAFLNSSEVSCTGGRAPLAQMRAVGCLGRATCIVSGAVCAVVVRWGWARSGRATSPKDALWGQMHESENIQPNLAPRTT